MERSSSHHLQYMWTFRGLKEAKRLLDMWSKNHKPYMCGMVHPMIIPVMNKAAIIHFLLAVVWINIDRSKVCTHNHDLYIEILAVRLDQVEGTSLSTKVMALDFSHDNSKSCGLIFG